MGSGNGLVSFNMSCNTSAAISAGIRQIYTQCGQLWLLVRQEITCRAYTLHKNKFTWMATPTDLMFWNVQIRGAVPQGLPIANRSILIIMKKACDCRQKFEEHTFHNRDSGLDIDCRLIEEYKVV